jgi:hypothetical protein
MKEDNQLKQDIKSDQKEDGSPRFGLLLMILVAAVGVIVLITFASESYYS